MPLAIDHPACNDYNYKGTKLQENHTLIPPRFLTFIHTRHYPTPPVAVHSRSVDTVFRNFFLQNGTGLRNYCYLCEKYDKGEKFLLEEHPFLLGSPAARNSTKFNSKSYKIFLFNFGSNFEKFLLEERPYSRSLAILETKRIQKRRNSLR